MHNEGQRAYRVEKGRLFVGGFDNDGKCGPMRHIADVESVTIETADHLQEEGDHT